MHTNFYNEEAGYSAVNAQVFDKYTVHTYPIIPLAFTFLSGPYFVPILYEKQPLTRIRYLRCANMKGMLKHAAAKNDTHFYEFAFQFDETIS